MQEFKPFFIGKQHFLPFISHLPPIYHHTKSQKTKPFQHISGSMAENLKKKNYSRVHGHANTSSVYLNNQGKYLFKAFDMAIPITATNNTFTMLTP